VPGRGDETKRVRELRSLDGPLDWLVVLFLFIMPFKPGLLISLFILSILGLKCIDLYAPRHSTALCSPHARLS